MRKQLFRKKAPVKQSQPQYPTLDDFDRGRRDFLVRLGGTLLGASALGTALTGCSDRAIPLDEENEAGLPRSDGGPSDPDMLRHTAGVAPEPDARIDEPDMEILGGAPRMPDARIDEPDMEIWGGVAPAPDAAIDDGGGSCPVP
jgi:hypothetical protein